MPFISGKELMMKKIIKLFSAMLTIALVAQISQCATIMSGQSQNVEFSSNPANAIVYVDGEQIGNTPVSKKLARNAEHEVRIELSGYAPYEVTLKKGLNGWVLGNILLGGIIGIVVDAVSGAIYQLTPSAVYTDFTAMSANRNSDDMLYISLTMNPEPGMKKIGQLTPSGQ